MSVNSSKIVYQSGAISLKEIETLRGKRVLLDLGCDAVIIVPRTEVGSYILTVQERVGKEGMVYEFPSGGIMSGENPEDAAARELLEEVGARGNLKLIKKVEPLSGIVKFSIYIFIADIIEINEENKSLEEYEDVSTIELTREELLEKVNSLEVIDGYLLFGLGVLSLANDSLKIL